jgi:hypothetical protein
LSKKIQELDILFSLYFKCKKHECCKTNFKCKYIPRIGATVIGTQACYFVGSRGLV